jgi:phage tail-like protein
MIHLANLPKEISGLIDVIGLEPLKRFQFAVQIDGDIFGSQYVFGFDKIEGLGDTVDVMEIDEGGSPNKSKIPTGSTTQPIKIYRVMSFHRGMWRWFEDVRSWTKGKPDYHRTLSIFIIDHVHMPFGMVKFEGQDIPFEVWRFDIFKAWPSEWSGPDLDSNVSEFARESVVIQHSGISEAKSIFSGAIASVASILQ